MKTSPVVRCWIVRQSMMILFLRALIFAAFSLPSDHHQMQLQTHTGSWDTLWRDVMDNITYKIQYFQLYYFCEFACFPMQCTIQNYSIVFINKSHKIGTESYITPRSVGHLKPYHSAWRGMGRWWMPSLWLLWMIRCYHCGHYGCSGVRYGQMMNAITITMVTMDAQVWGMGRWWMI